MNKNWFILGLVLLLGSVFLLSGCIQEDQTSNLDQKLIVTSISPLADLIKNVGGDEIEVIHLVPEGSDPHTFEPTPDAIRSLTAARIFFANGVGQENYLERLIKNAQNPSLITVVLSEGLEILGVETKEEEHEHNSDHDHDDHGHDHSQGNPHLWLSVENSQKYVEKIRDTLIEIYPESQEIFAANAENYLKELRDLDRWIKEQISTIPEENREVIVHHDAWAYYASSYGLNIRSSIVHSEEGEPSAQEYAQVINLIKDHNIKGIFSEVGFNTKIVQQIANETNANIIHDLYSDTLGSTPHTDSYIDIMKYNTLRIVEGLS
ncbi:MAG: zinc ABC transporter substrate-binding protein [Desulfitobacterium sp.]|nr:zinc ABC transporter substrate-binding protein [Desulfitobacterium sp.]